MGIALTKTPKDRAKLLITAWLHLQMRGEQEFESWFNGEEHMQHLAEDWFSRIEYQPGS